MLCRLYPLDRTANGDGLRRSFEPPASPPPASPQQMPPLLQKLLDERAATGLPPAYLPKNEEKKP